MINIEKDAFWLGYNLALHSHVLNTGIQIGAWLQSANYAPKFQEEARKFDWDCSYEVAVVQATEVICNVLKRETHRVRLLLHMKKLSNGLLNLKSYTI